MNNLLNLSLRGGLGNQLFIYAAGLYFADANDYFLKILTQDIDHLECISRFNLSGHFDNSNLIFKPRIKNKINKLLDIFTQPKLDKGKPLIHISDPGFSEVTLNIPAGATLSGFFQTSTFAEILIGKGFQFNLKTVHGNKWVNEINSSETLSKSILIHVRLGDYLKGKLTFGALESDYYLKAVELIPNFESLNKIIISDDIPLAKALFAGTKLESARYLIPPKGVSNADVMTIFSHVHAIVMSNSSYSWWGSFTSTSALHVVAPDQWFRSKELNDQVVQNIHQDSWIKSKSYWQN
jgi:hypothetical protein